jgi:transcriptional regulator with XRE-family HTH domain
MPDNLQARTGNRIRKWRMEAGLTQQQLAVKVGTTQSHISELESDAGHNTTLAMLERIAEALGKDLTVDGK